MRSDKFLSLVELGEIRGVEFKGSQALTTPKPLKVIRSILGLSNRRNGGYVIVGVSEDDEGLPVLQGMTSDHHDTWSLDSLVDVVADYGEPRPELRLERYEHTDGTLFVVIDVHEFSDQPVLCKKDGGDGVLRRGALYIRPRGKAQTVENGSMEDMRALLDLATEKRLRELLGTIERAGASVEIDANGPSAADLYDAELGEFLDGN